APPRGPAWNLPSLDRRYDPRPGCLAGCGRSHGLPAGPDTDPTRPRPAATSTTVALAATAPQDHAQARVEVRATSPARPELRHCLGRIVTRQERTGQSLANVRL